MKIPKELSEYVNRRTDSQKKKDRKQQLPTTPLWGELMWSGKVVHSQPTTLVVLIIYKSGEKQWTRIVTPYKQNIFFVKINIQSLFLFWLLNLIQLYFVSDSFCFVQITVTSHCLHYLLNLYFYIFLFYVICWIFILIFTWTFCIYE